MPVLRSVVTIVSRALSGARPQPCFREAETATGQGWAGLGEAGQGRARLGEAGMRTRTRGWRLLEAGDRAEADQSWCRPAVRPRPVPHGLRHLGQSQPAHDWPNPGLPGTVGG